MQKQNTQTDSPEVGKPAQVKKQYRHDLGFKLEMQNKTDGRYIIMIQDDIDNHPTLLNPETITGKLLWFTTEGGYDYCHPHSRAKERAEKICKSYNEYDQLQQDKTRLEGQVRELRDALKPFAAIIDEVPESQKKNNDRELFGYNNGVITIGQLKAAKETLNNTNP